jgi:hypothetical protein
MSKKKRRQTNIDEDQAQEIDLLPEAKRMTFAAIVRVLIDEALSQRQGGKALTLLPTQVEGYFEAWGLDKVKALAIACIEFIEQNASARHTESDRFLKDLHLQRVPTDESLVLLADTLDIPVEKLISVRNCFLKKEAVNGNGGN